MPFLIYGNLDLPLLPQRNYSGLCDVFPFSKSNGCFLVPILFLGSIRPSLPFSLSLASMVSLFPDFLLLNMSP